MLSLRLRVDNKVIRVAYVWVSTYVVLVCATIVGQAWTALALMTYTAVRTLAYTPATQQSVRPLRKPWRQQRLLCIWTRHRADRKHPGGATVTPWHRGRILIWDVTCPDAFAASCQQPAVRKAGAVACQAECRKQVKYAELTATHHFVPMAIDTTEVFRLEARSFLSEPGTGRDGRLLPATTYCSGLQWQYRGQCCCSAGHVVSGQRLVRPFFTQKACDRRDLLVGITICFLGTLSLALNDC